MNEALVRGPVVLLIGARRLGPQVAQRLSLGVDAVVTSADCLDDLASACRSVLGGGSYVSPTAAPIVLSACRGTPGDGGGLHRTA